MKTRYLEVTFRKGKPLAAYLYLPREPGAKSARTELMGSGLLVDYQADGRPIGLEITAPDINDPGQDYTNFVFIEESFIEGDTIVVGGE